jgi:hypothetical protein
MKRIALLWSLVTLVVLAGCQPIVAPATPAPDEAQSATQDDIYSDPQGRFTVPIPANWTATTRDGYALLTSPQDEIEVARSKLRLLCYQMRIQRQQSPKLGLQSIQFLIRQY